MKSMLLLLLAGGLTAVSPAHADDADFLRSFQGSFAGNGTVKVTTNAPTVNVSCTFNSGATSTSLSLDGNCRGLVLVTRAISADLKSNGKGYTGVYVGSRTGPARLNGKRSGNALSLAIRWAKEVNGDRTARLTVEKTSGDGMRLTVTDADPKTGKTVVTSRIDLKRT
ncbi:MAG: hypothetical protein EOS58_16405 [Mesorhizobium sp.]|uniref:hypothetical protein n=1 Tax=unclassified Mesorhizobium TaxID=325217 RepID=UPI000F76550C|nr:MULTISPECIES: hypothetical protein [unclassified Mesorhizobium]AZO46800.1 hypothetical protein EJ073_02480 [Mesorhizobium sp. M4B.F.Ca.ET.058.02.1.1]RVC44589.1 hypothetical protein EN781_13410 [Mesorhizobium sp. M4A.F.Ca.ET.090.04.2.1]RVC76088.1 hypothetical protein EN745_25715 [Mesorhizobium sp. M4A.F.Ca.ET.022.05.2.1]RWC53703.1 MAG: hypothetical protein EOS54_12230 [Mesorhizobium sp.]RWD03647.1 MAG: hypothetical protein EOS58_16405 [Mesorhizobium sp.]